MSLSPKAAQDLCRPLQSSEVAKGDTEPLLDTAGSRDQARSILQPLSGALKVLCSKPEQERMLSRWLGQLSADQFASRCVRPIMRHVDSVAPQLVSIPGKLNLNCCHWRKLLTGDAHNCTATLSGLSCAM